MADIVIGLDAEQLSNKIDWEGGIAEAFLSYFAPSDVLDEELNKKVVALQNAYLGVQARLAELGVEAY